MSTQISASELRATYRDMSDEELAELELDRSDLTEEARLTLDAELLRRNLDVQPRVAEMRRERFLEMLRRWNDDDFLHYVRTQAVEEAWQRALLRDEILRRDLDAGTFLGATEREGQEPSIVNPAILPEIHPFRYGVVVPPEGEC